MAGNVLGGRSYYGYTSDSGDNYSILMDDSLAAAVGAVLNTLNPSPPRRFRPRGVYCEALTAGGLKRKFIVIPTPAAAEYATNTTTQVEIDGLNFQTTGRKGERLSFPINSGDPDPGDADAII